MVARKLTKCSATETAASSQPCLVLSYNVAPHPALDAYHKNQTKRLAVRDRLLCRVDKVKQKDGTFSEVEVIRENVTVYLDDQGEVKFYFDEEEAERWIKFIETYCTHAKAKWAKAPLILDPWQKWIIREFFGWRKIGTALRRYKYLFLFLPRKNGKSLLIAALALGFLLIDRENTPEVYATASTDVQAGKLFEMAQAMVAQNEDLKKRLEPYRGNISCPKNGGYFRPIPFNPDAFHGANPSAVILDEYHVQKTTGMKRVGETGMGAREQPAVLIITTAGNKRGTPCEIELNYAKNIRDGVLEKDNYLPCIFQAKDGAEWSDIQTAIDCNPCYPASPSKDFLLDEIEKALANPVVALEYKQLQLNRFIDERKIWLDYDIWVQTKKHFDFREFRKEKVHAGLDLASVYDLSALVLCKPGGLYEGDWYLHAHFWCCAQTIVDKRMFLPYEVWKKQGWLVETPGTATDQGYIKRQIIAYNKFFNIGKSYTDEHQARNMIGELREEEGMDWETMGQGWRSMTEPIKFMITLAKQGRLKTNNPILDWMAANTLLVSFDNEERGVKFDKADDACKIDGMVASAMAVSAALRDLGEPDYYAERGLLLA